MVNLNTSFNPASLTIARGTTVTWKNGDGITHTTTSNPSNPAGCPAWNNTVGASGTSAGVTFSPSAAVTCQYFCSIHATATTGAMRGSIIVQ
jgi:plastocyanin